MLAKFALLAALLSSTLSITALVTTPECEEQIVNSMVLFPGDDGHDANGNQDGEPVTICVR